MTLITKFSEFMRKKAMASKRFDMTEERVKEEKKSKVQCYECKEYGCMKYECLNKEKEEKKMNVN